MKFTTDSERAAVEKIISHINERGNPFDISVAITRNIVSGEKLDNELLVFEANCLVLGEEEYQKFKDERLEKKVITLFDPIPKLTMKRFNSKSSSLTQRCQKSPDIRKKR